MKLTKFSLITTGAFLLPYLAFAQTGGSFAGSGVANIIRFVKDIINAITPIFIAVAVLFLFYSIIMYIWGNQGDAEGKAKSQKNIWMSLVAIGIMLTFFAIIRLVAESILGQGAIGDDVTTQDIGGVEL